MDFSSWLERPPECPADLPSVLESLTVIGGPTGEEGRRTDFIQAWVERETGWSSFRDEIDNLVVDLSGGAYGVYLLEAHIDTVFPDRRVAIVKDGDEWRGPGVFDNTLACVQLMLLLRELAACRVCLPLVIAFSVGEEGTGNLSGIRSILQRYGERVAEVCAFDMGLSQIVMQAVGSIRWKVHFQATGGHSWGAFGAPSAIHAAARWVTGMPDRFTWKRHENTYNIGVIRGGTGVNAIAENLELMLDLRSIDAHQLTTRAAVIEQEWKTFEEREGVRIVAEQIGFRPAGQVPPGARVVTAMRQAIEGLGMVVEETAGSNNANAALAEGIPASCTGLGVGGKSHTRDEFLKLPSALTGWQKLCMMVAELVS